MEKAATNAKNCNSFRYRKVVLTILLSFGIVLTGLRAQNIYFKFSDSKYSQYSLDDIRTITYTTSSMNLNMVNGTIVSLPTNTISSFNYTGYIGITGITRPTGESGISVYPNPGHGKFTINYTAPSSGEVAFDFLTTKGEILNTHFQQSKAGNNTLSINTNDFKGKDLPPGIYLCRIRNSEKSSVIKIIISK